MSTKTKVTTAVAIALLMGLTYTLTLSKQDTEVSLQPNESPVEQTEVTELIVEKTTPTVSEPTTTQPPQTKTQPPVVSSVVTPNPQATSSSAPVSTTIPAARNETKNDWQTFTSNQLKVSFQYPNTWDIEESNFGMLSINPPKNLINSEEIIFDMGIFVDENIENTTLHFDDVITFTKDYYDDPSYYQTISEKEIHIQNVKAFSAVYIKKGGNLKKSQISFLYNNQIYGIRFYAPEDIHNEYLDTFEEIISSINFIDN